MEFLFKTIFYGCIGLLLEVFFTGLHSVIILKSRDAISRTSLWMLPIYGLGADGLGLIRNWLGFSRPLFIFVAVLFIYLLEYISGRILRLLKVKVWDYSHSRFSLHGLVRADYLPFWFLVAFCFDQLCDVMDKIFIYAGTFGI